MTRAEFKVEINSCLDAIRQERGEAFARAYFDKLADHDLFVTYPDYYDKALDIWKMRLKFLSLEDFVSYGGSWQTASASLYTRCKASTLEACYIWSARNYLYDMYGFDLLGPIGSYDSAFIISMLKEAACLDDRYIYIGYDPTELLTRERDLDHEIAYLKHRILWTLIATLDGTVPLNVMGAKYRAIDELLDCGFIEKEPTSNCFCCDYALERVRDGRCTYCPVIARSIVLPDRARFFVSQLGCGCENVGGYYHTLCGVNDSISDSTRRKIAAKIALFPRSAFVNNLGKKINDSSSYKAVGFRILSDCAIACRYLCEYMLAENAEEREEIEEQFNDFKYDENKTFIDALRATILNILSHYYNIFERDDSADEEGSVHYDLESYLTDNEGAKHLIKTFRLAQNSYYGTSPDKPKRERSSNTMNSGKLTLNEKLYNKKDGDLMVKKQLALLDEFVDCTNKLTRVAEKWLNLIEEMDREP